jgi:outer membrane receptor protein involved in Fe transport
MFTDVSKYWPGGAALAAIMLVDGTAAAQSIARHRFDLPPMELSEALRQVAVRTGTNLLVPDELVRSRRASALVGEFSAEEAVRRLLQGSGLSYRFSGRTLIIAAAGPASDAADSADDRNETIVVTGSHVRGAPPTSPVITLTRRQIEEAAPASVEDLMRRLPQNLSAGVAQENFAVTGTGADITQHGAGINLRGLGQRATLVLVNGRRIAPSGVGSFVDISLLPVSAIDRVEVLTDGASAIYGSDAVGGVVNFILRKDFDGVEPMVQIGTATRGGGRQLLAGVTGGRRWTGGRALLSYEYRDEQPIKAKDRDFTINLPGEWMLSPSERRHSLYGTVRQELNDRLVLDVSGTYAARNTSRSFFEGSAALAVDVDARARSIGGTTALGLDLGGSWAAEASASYFRSRTRQVQRQGGALYNRLNTLNAFSEFGVKADGPLVELPAGPLKLAAGAGVRRERFTSLFETSVNAPSEQSGSRTVMSAYGELNLPLFGARNRRPGIEQLTATAAGRFEHYEGIGSTFNPKVGLLWSPLEGLAFRSSYGTSFRAPLLSESLGNYNIFLFPAALLFIDPSQAPPGVGASLIGNNREVTPESSRSFSVGAEVAPPFMSGLRLAATYYSIRFSDRIALPTEQIVVIGDPALAPIVTLDPSLDLVTGFFGGAGQILDFSGPNFTNGGAGPEDVVAIVDARVSNTAETRTSGLDLLLDHAFELGSNRLHLSLNANKVFRFDDKLTKASPWIHTLNTPFHAVDWRARAGLSWSRGPLSAAAFLNYTDSYRDNRGLEERPVRSFTTVDAGLAFDGAQGRWAWARPFRLAVNVHNLFDGDPPRLLPDPGFSRGIGYDPVNATGRGRTVSLQLRAGL